MTDEELKQLIAGLAIAQQKNDEQIAGFAVAQKKNDEQIAGLAVTQQKNDEQIAGLAVTQQKNDEQIAGLAITQQKNDEQIAELVASRKKAEERFDKEMEKLIAQQKKLGDLFGNMGQNQGHIAEEFFYNSLIEDTHLGAIHFEDVTANMQKHRGQIQEEYDLVLTNGDTVGIIEVKYKAHEKDLDKLERKMRNFKKLFPLYQNYKLYGALAAFHVNKEAKQAALERGFFVLQRSGKVIHTDSAENLLVM
jgi:hypothetical protein